MAALLVSFLLLMILGCPIAFCLLCSGTIYFMTNNMALIMVVQRLTEGANTFTLLAVPGFILAGNLMNSGEVTDRIFDFCGKLVGHITGGLGHANILASVVFAGMSGAAIADAGGLGAIELKAMHDAGYDDDFSLAVTGASSLVGPIIPPSVPAVVYGTVASVSIGRLFMAGAVPGAIMAIAMCAMVYIISKKRGYRKRRVVWVQGIVSFFQKSISFASDCSCYSRGNSCRYLHTDRGSNYRNILRDFSRILLSHTDIKKAACSIKGSQRDNVYRYDDRLWCNNLLLHPFF